MIKQDAPATAPATPFAPQKLTTDMLTPEERMRWLGLLYGLSKLRSARALLDAEEAERKPKAD